MYEIDFVRAPLGEHGGGTSLQGVCEDINYIELVEIFGEPDDGDGDKVDAEWVLISDEGEICTIYNYKTGPSYDPEGIPVQEMYDDYWHIGGRNEEVAEKLNDFLARQIARQEA